MSLSDATIAVLVTGTVGVVSPLVLSYFSWRRQLRDHAADLERERRDTLRDVFEQGATMLREAAMDLSATSLRASGVSEKQQFEAIGRVRATWDRLLLYLPEHHPVAVTYDRATGWLFNLHTSEDESLEPAIREAFAKALAEYMAACRVLLDGDSEARTADAGGRPTPTGGALPASGS
jgi:hypothetical protein